MMWYNDLAAFVKEQQWVYGAALGIDNGDCVVACLESNKDLRMLGLDLWGGAAIDFDAKEHSCRELCKPYGNRALLLKGDAAIIAKGFRIKTFDFALYNCYDEQYTATDYHERILKIWVTKVKDGGLIISADLDRQELLEALANVGVNAIAQPLMVNGKESEHLKFIRLN